MESLTEARRAALLLACLAVVFTGLRLLLASFLELAPDEAYYWLWSRELRLSYPDHPPMVAILIRLGTSMTSDSELGVRLFFAMSTMPSMALVFALSRELGLNLRWSIASAAMTAMLPIVSAGSLIATPDTPLGLAWLLGTLCLVRLSKPGRRRFGADDLGLAVSLALGLWSKHSALLLVGLTAFVALRQARAQAPRMGLALALGILLASPSWISDLRSDSGAALNQLDHLLGRWSPNAQSGPLVIAQRLSELVGGQIGLITPFIAVLAWLGRVYDRRDPLGRLLAASYLFPFVATALAAFMTHPQQNWASLGHPAIVVLACRTASDHWTKATVRRLWWGSVSTVILAAALIHTHAISPFLPLPPLRDPVSRLHGWNELRTQLVPRSETANVLCDHYGLGAELAWQWRDLHPRVSIAWEDRPSPRLPGEPDLLLDALDDPGHSRLQTLPVKASEQLLELRRRDGAVVHRIRTWVMP